MHNKYGKDGLAAVSVSLDDPSDVTVMKRINDFLKKQKATFRNFVLKEKPEVWQEKLQIDGPPAVFVFDREGKPKKFAPADYEEIEKYVAELLKK